MLVVYFFGKAHVDWDRFQANDRLQICEYFSLLCFQMFE